MKSPFVRVGEILVLLMGIGALAGFLLLPFGRNAITFSLENGLQAIQSYTKWVLRPGYLNSSQIDPTILVSLIGHWGTVGLSALIIVLALIQLFTKPGKVLPMVTLFVSLFGIISLFLAFYAISTPGDFFVVRMFQGTVVGPILGIGWWICAGCLFLTLVLSIMIERSSPFSRNSQYRI